MHLQVQQSYYICDTSCNQTVFREQTLNVLSDDDSLKLQETLKKQASGNFQEEENLDKLLTLQNISGISQISKSHKFLRVS